MTHNREITPVEEGGRVLSAADIKALALMNTVLSWMEENASYNWSEACTALGVSRTSLYRAIKNEAVQGMAADWYMERAIAKAKLIHDSEIPVLMNMVGIAKDSRDARAAVAAARFLHEVSKEVQEATAGTGPQGESEAARLLKRWKGPVKLKQTTVTQEVELTDPDSESFPSEN